MANSTDPNQKTDHSGIMQAKTELIREARIIAVAMIPVAAAFVLGQIATFPNLTP